MFALAFGIWMQELIKGQHLPFARYVVEREGPFYNKSLSENATCPASGKKAGTSR